MGKLATWLMAQPHMTLSCRKCCRHVVLELYLASLIQHPQAAHCGGNEVVQVHLTGCNAKKGVSIKDSCYSAMSCPEAPALTASISCRI